MRHDPEATASNGAWAPDGGRRIREGWQEYGVAGRGAWPSRVSCRGSPTPDASHRPLPSDGFAVLGGVLDSRPATRDSRRFFPPPAQGATSPKVAALLGEDLEEYGVAGRGAVPNAATWSRGSGLATRDSRRRRRRHMTSPSARLF